MSLLIFHPWELNTLESADRYQTCSCLELSKNKPQINADERRLIKSDEEKTLLIFRSIILDFFENVIMLRGSDKRRLIHKSNHESADQYKARSSMGLLKNKPQINADERRLIKSDKEISLPIFSSNILEFLENDKLLRGSDRRRLIKLDDEPCLSILNSILSRHLFNRTYSSHNYCS